MSIESCFKMGIEYYKSKDYEKALYYLEKVKNDKILSSKAIGIIFQIYFRHGLFNKARDVLNNTNFYYYMGLLEEYEGNLNEAYKYFNLALQSKEGYKETLLALARVYAELGFNKEALDILNKLTETDVAIRAQFEKICLLTRTFQYQKAYQILEEINTQRLTSNTRKDYKDLIVLLKYRLNLLNKEKFSPQTEYPAYLLVTKDDDVLLKHINLHTRQSDRYTYGCFFSNIDLNNLLNDVKEKIDSLNPIYCNKTDFYRFSFDRSIGFKGSDKTKDVTVITLLGTKQIITMYPVMFSPRFDTEKLNHDKDLQMIRRKL